MTDSMTDKSNPITPPQTPPARMSTSKPEVLRCYVEVQDHATGRRPGKTFYGVAADDIFEILNMVAEKGGPEWLRHAYATIPAIEVPA